MSSTPQPPLVVAEPSLPSPKNPLPPVWVVPDGKYRRTLRAASAVAEALFSTEKGAPPKERLGWFEREMAVILERAGWRSGGFFRVGVFLLSVIAPLFVGRLLPLRTLPVAQRILALRRMEKSPFGTVVLGVKVIFCTVWYEHPDSAAEVNYLGGCLRRVP